MTSALASPLYSRGSRQVATVLAVLLVAGCRPAPAAPIVVAPPAAALTPFQPSTATPTVEVVRIWVSPSVPPALGREFEEDVETSGMTVEWAAKPDSASVQLRPSSSRPYALWTYAVVSAFPTLADGLVWDAFASRWKGTDEESGPVWATPDVRALLEDVLGPPAASAVAHAPRSFTRGVFHWRPPAQSAYGPEGDHTVGYLDSEAVCFHLSRSLT